MAGVGVPRDSIKAYEWCLLAVAGGESRADTALSQLRFHLPVTKRATAEERVEAWEPKINART
jgi:hypothetical protein